LNWRGETDGYFVDIRGFPPLTEGPIYDSRGPDLAHATLNHREVPIMDGSSAPLLYLLQEAGVKKLSPARRFLKILKPVQIASGDKRIAIYPSDHFKVSYTISFDRPMLRHQGQGVRRRHCRGCPGARGGERPDHVLHLARRCASRPPSSSVRPPHARGNLEGRHLGDQVL
jgi:hypothetical protein